jgi:ABC-type nitrate/sulfonate/bicarbonate transport system permease component
MGRETSNTDAVIAVMILIIGLGYIVDGVIFKSLERHLQHKWGLTPST